MRKFTLSAALIVAALALAAGFAGAAKKMGTEPARNGVRDGARARPGSVTAFDAATGRPIWTPGRARRRSASSSRAGRTRSTRRTRARTRCRCSTAGPARSLKTIPMGPGPHHLMASRNGERIYVGEFGQNTVGVVDTASDTEIAHYVASPLPNARTHAVYITRTARTSTPPTRARTAPDRATSHTSTPAPGRCSATPTSASTRARSSSRRTAGAATSPSAARTRSRSSTCAATVPC